MIHHEWERSWSSKIGPASFYSCLNIGNTANEKVIKKAYRQQALRYHPDRNAGDNNAEAMFKNVSEAYRVLSDTQARIRYNNMLDKSIRDKGLFGIIVNELDNHQDIVFSSESYHLFRELYQAEGNFNSLYPELGNTKCTSSNTERQSNDNQCTHSIYGGIIQSVPSGTIAKVAATVVGLSIAYNLYTSNDVLDQFQAREAPMLERTVEPVTCKNVHSLYEHAKNFADYEQVKMYRGIMRKCNK